MWKQLLILVLVLAGLMAWERGLAERTTRERQAGVRIEFLLNAEEVFTEDRPIAAFRLDRNEQGAQAHLYVMTDGVWRSVSAHGTIALNEAIGALVPKLTNAEGYVMTRAAAAAREFGFDTEEMLRLSVCGPDVLTDPGGDVIYALDIGNSIPETGGSYVRPTGTTEIWAIDMNFREELESDVGPSVPPMLDPRILPSAWPGFEPPGVDRIVVEMPNEPPLELQRYDREVTDEQIARGEPAWEWSVKKGEIEYVGDPFQIFSYGGFLTNAPYAGILSPRLQNDLGLDDLRARITLRSVHGQHVQLLVGGEAPRGGIAVVNTFSGNIFEVNPGIAELLVPEMDMLLTDQLGNPWEQFLERP